MKTWEKIIFVIVIIMTILALIRTSRDEDPYGKVWYSTDDVVITVDENEGGDYTIYMCLLEDGAMKVKEFATCPEERLVYEVDQAVDFYWQTLGR